MSRLHGSDKKVLGFLVPMFPQLSLEVIEKSILHPSNRHGMFDHVDEFTLLDRCIEDLLVQRTWPLVEPNGMTGNVGSQSMQSNSSLKNLGIYGSSDISFCGTNAGGSVNIPNAVEQNVHFSHNVNVAPPNTNYFAAGVPHMSYVHQTNVHGDPGRYGGVGSSHNPYFLDAPLDMSAGSSAQALGPVHSVPDDGNHGNTYNAGINHQGDAPHGYGTDHSGTHALSNAFSGGTNTGAFMSYGSGYRFDAANQPDVSTGARAEAAMHDGLAAPGPSTTSNNRPLPPDELPSLEVPEAPRIQGVGESMPHTKPKATPAPVLEITYESTDSSDLENTDHFPNEYQSDYDDDELPDLPDEFDFKIPDHQKLIPKQIPHSFPKAPKEETPVQGVRNFTSVVYDKNLTEKAGTTGKDLNQNKINSGDNVPGTSAAVAGASASAQPMPSTSKVTSNIQHTPVQNVVRNPNIGPVAGPVAGPSTSGPQKRPRSPDPVVTAMSYSVPASVGTVLCQGAAAPDVIVENVYRPEVINVPDVEPPKKEKTAEDILEERTESICSLFPEADPAFVRQQLRFAVHNDPETVVCNYLLENPGYPKKTAKKSLQSPQLPGAAADPVPGTSCSPSVSSLPVSSVDYYKEYSSPVGKEYCNQAFSLLRGEFRKVPVNDLRTVARWFKNHYAPTRKLLIETLRNHGIAINETEGTIGCNQKFLFSNMTIPYDPSAPDIIIKHGECPPLKLKFLKCGRNKVGFHFQMVPDLEEEASFILRNYKSDAETKDHQMAEALNETEYQEEGQAIECGCCYGDCPFDTMVQCYEGHLFCQTCLKSYVQEAVFGQGKTKLECLSDGCEASFPKSELLRAVPSNVVDKFEEKQQEQSLNMADMADLVRCPHCDYAAVLDPGVRVFKCQNKTCLKETCRHCKENWEDHFGIPCNELEKKDETKLRLQFEEKMTQAKIRTCHKCKAGFTKTDGCNKMTCPCGSKMCYICRKPNIDYNHFCNHPRDPGKKCLKCSSCSLWTNPEEDDERAVDEIKREARQAREAQGFTDNKLIGAPGEEPKAKKPRKH